MFKFQTCRDQKRIPNVGDELVVLRFCCWFSGDDNSLSKLDLPNNIGVQTRYPVKVIDNSVDIKVKLNPSKNIKRNFPEILVFDKFNWRPSIHNKTCYLFESEEEINQIKEHEKRTQDMINTMKSCAFFLTNDDFDSVTKIFQNRIDERKKIIKTYNESLSENQNTK